METDTKEQALRRAAIRRRLAQEKRKTICTDLERSTRQFKIRTTAISGDFCVSHLANSHKVPSEKELWRRLADRSQSL